MVYGALDGVVTTMAIIAGSAGAGLGVRVAVVLGIANLVADGISMGASNFLGLKSELQQSGRPIAAEAPWRHGAATVAAFVAVGSIPLAGYIVGPLVGIAPLVAAALLSGAALVAAGALRARFVGTSPARSAGEMLAIAGLAYGAAYLIGWMARVVGS